MQTTIDAVLPEKPLWERVHRALKSSPYLTESQVHFATRRGEVTLHGSVGTFFQKQMAQEALRRIDGIERVENQLEVAR